MQSVAVYHPNDESRSAVIATEIIGGFIGRCAKTARPPRMNKATVQPDKKDHPKQTPSGKGGAPASATRVQTGSLLGQRAISYSGCGSVLGGPV